MPKPDLTKYLVDKFAAKLMTTPPAWAGGVCDSTATTSAASNVNSTPLVTIESLQAAVASLPPRPFVNPDQCKACGTILGEQFEGVPGTPAVPLFYNQHGVWSSMPLCYLCPPCMERLRKTVNDQKESP